MSGKKQFLELDNLIDHLRTKGITAFKGDYPGGTVELVLLPEEPFKAPKETKKDREEQVSKRKGADGLTAEEQRERYGRVVDAEE